MKRNLVQNNKVAPYASGDPIDREGFQSAILGVTAGATGALTVTVTHSDDDTAYKAIEDELVFMKHRVADGVLTLDVEKDDLTNVDIDLIGCKRFVKIALSGAAATGAKAAIALGDADWMPV